MTICSLKLLERQGILAGPLLKLKQRVYDKDMLLRRKHISVTIVTDIFNKNFKSVIQFCLNY